LGQLGTGNVGGVSASAVPVVGLSKVNEIAVGFDHACALDQGGTVWCWGGNSNGQLGDGTVGDPRPRADTPAQISDVIHIAAGLQLTCAVKRDGTAWCWGLNNLGQLGNGSQVAQQPLPVQVNNVSDVAQISSGGYEITGLYGHVCARSNQGKLWCWGGNLFGEIGDGTAGSNPHATPTLLSSLPDAIGLGVGAKHSCAIRRNGTLWCWGANDTGQLGTGNLNELHAPQRTELSCQ
jgi:alpha-tubulin suppressor-like RCC1 family protein